MLNVPSLQRFTSHGHSYWRIVESYRRRDGKPAIRTLLHIGKADELLRRLQGEEQGLKVHSVSSGAVDALWALSGELDVVGHIDRAIDSAGARLQHRDGLSVGQSLLAAAIARLCHPASKRAFAEWAATTTLPRHLKADPQALTSQHFWDQMNAMPAEAIVLAEEAVVAAAVATGIRAQGVIAYDTTNFFTHIDTTNGRVQLAQRGHNKQRRHDLRQLGLALVVSEEGQIPLGHKLYEGSRPDVVAFAQALAPLRARLRRLQPQEGQMTLVFDQGAESAAALGELRESSTHYVTALKPSHHRAFLAKAAERLEPLALSTGETVRAWRTRLSVHGVEHTVVVVWSRKLWEGQCRGLQQHLDKALGRLKEISVHPRGGAEGARAQVDRICSAQYLRRILRCEIDTQADSVLVKPTLDLEARRQLEEHYFGLRILATTRDEWTTPQIIEAYRGQARAERAFRDLKDPWVCAFRPQYHWTDQKLLVHAFIAVLALILGRTLLFRAQQRLGLHTTLRGLISRLAMVRTATLIRHGHGRGRPTVTEQLEECPPALLALAASFAATPS
jgi:transposase